MGRYRRKSSRNPKRARVPECSGAAPATPSEPTVLAASIAELAVDIWKISRRVAQEGCAERVATACERAEQRIKSIGFEIDTMVGKAYDRNMRVRVVENEPADGERKIAECLAPAVYFQGVLVREGEVVTRGR